MSQFHRKTMRTAGLPKNLLAKWPEDLLDEGYTPLPKKVLRVLGDLFRGEAGIDAFRAVMAIVDYRRPDLEHLPSVEFLAFTAGLSPERFTELLEELERRRFVERQGNEANIELQLTGFADAVRKAVLAQDAEE